MACLINTLRLLYSIDGLNQLEDQNQMGISAQKKEGFENCFQCVTQKNKQIENFQYHSNTIKIDMPKVLILFNL